MTRTDIIAVLAKARPDVPKSFWDILDDEEMNLQLGLIRDWMKQHAREAEFA